MAFHSLRSKIFALVVAMLVIVAAFVMLVTRHDVTRTVVRGEQQAVDNVLDLVLRDTEARWGALLADKIDTVRGARRQLMQLGRMVDSVLAGYAEMAARGVVSEGAARGMARNWVNGLQLDDRRYAMLYDAELRVLASGDRRLLDMDIGAVRDFKNRPMARAMYEETRASGYGFAIYRLAQPDAGAETRYAYFGHFPAWDWVIVISDSAQDVLEQFAHRRADMEESLRNALGKLKLAQTGFVFIVGRDGELVIAPPDDQAGLLDRTDAAGVPLRQALQSLPASGTPRQFVVGASEDALWQVDAARFKPLGWVIGAAVPRRDLTAPATRLVNRQALAFGLTLLAALAVAWVMAARMARPLNQLTRYARQLPEQDLTAAPQVPPQVAALPSRHRDETGRLAESFLFMDAKLRENVARLMSETTARQRYESELNIARDIQLGLLPVPLPDDVRGRVSLHAAMLPAKEVGGDLYDYFMLPDGRLCIAIGDVSDKGVPAALFMAVTRTLLRASAEDETDPALLMERVNNRLAENNPNVMFVTLFVAVLDLHSGRLDWANAGHPAPCVVGVDGRVRRLEGRSGPACGVQEGLPYRGMSATLAPGEVLVGYTDGVTEAADGAGQQYGEARLDAVLAQAPREVDALADALLQDVRRFVAGAEQSDDITLIVVRRS